MKYWQVVALAFCYFLFTKPVAANEKDFGLTTHYNPLTKKTESVRYNLYGDIKMIGNSVLECDQAYYYKKQGLKIGSTTYEKMDFDYSKSQYPDYKTKGFMRFYKTGTYQFRIRTDQWIALNFDDNWIAGSSTGWHKGDKTFSLSLEENRMYAFSFWYDKEDHINDHLVLEYKEPGSSTYEVVPKEVFYYTFNGWDSCPGGESPDIIPNNGIKTGYANINPSQGFFNLTSADFDLPEVSEVKWAGLFWQGRTISDASLWGKRTHVEFKAPNMSSFETLTGDCEDINEDARKNYVCYKDITEYLKDSDPSSAPSYSPLTNSSPDTFFVGNVATSKGEENTYGAWALVVIYEDTDSRCNECVNDTKTPTECQFVDDNCHTYKNISVFDGYLNVGDDTKLPIELQGFFTPTTGDVNSKFLIFAGEGDVGTDNISFDWARGDYVKMSDTDTGAPNVFLQDSLNPKDDIFNSHITELGRLVTNRKPSHDNTIGIDIATFDVGTTGLKIIGNARNGTKVKLGSNGDQYFPSVFAFSTELYKPDICFQEEKEGFKNITNPGATEIKIGDVIEMTVRVENREKETATGVRVFKEFDSEQEYVGESTYIWGFSDPAGIHGNPWFQTDGSSDDNVSYLDADKKLELYMGENAFYGNGGQLKENEYQMFKYRMEISGFTPDGKVKDKGTYKVDYKAKWGSIELDFKDQVMERCGDRLKTKIYEPRAVCYVQDVYKYKSDASGKPDLSAILNPSNKLATGDTVRKNDALAFHITIRNTGIADVKSLKITKRFFPEDNTTDHIAQDKTLGSYSLFVDKNTDGSIIGQTDDNDDDLAAHDDDQNLSAFHIGQGASGTLSGDGGALDTAKDTSLLYVAKVIDVPETGKFTNVFEAKYLFVSTVDGSTLPADEKISLCQGEKETELGILPAGAFRIISSTQTNLDAGCDGNITTQIAGKEMDLKLIYCEEGIHKILGGSSDVKVTVVMSDNNNTTDMSDALGSRSGDKMEWKDISFKTTDDMIDFPPQEPKQYDKVIRQAYFKTMEKEDGYERGYSNNFAVRPDRFEFNLSTMPSKIRAGEHFDLNVTACLHGKPCQVAPGYEDVNVSIYGPYDSAPPSDRSYGAELNTSELRKECAVNERNITTSYQDNNFSEGVAGLKSLMYNEVSFNWDGSEQNGSVELNISEVLGWEFARVDSNDTNDSDRLISKGSTTLTIVPYEINISEGTFEYNRTLGGVNDPLKNDNNWTYMDAALDRNNVGIGFLLAAYAKDRNVTRNFSHTCDAVDINTSFHFEINATDDKDTVMMAVQETNNSQTLGIFRDTSLANFVEYNLTAYASDFTDGNSSQLGFIYNINRSGQNKLEPIRIQLYDINITNNIGAHNATIPTSFDNNVTTFLYGRLNPLDGKETRAGDNEINTTINYEVFVRQDGHLFCQAIGNSDNNCTRFGGGVELSPNDIYWWINPDHPNWIRVDSAVTYRPSPTGLTEDLTKVPEKGKQSTRYSGYSATESGRIKATINHRDSSLNLNYLFYNRFRDDGQTSYFLEYFAPPGTNADQTVSQNRDVESGGTSRIGY